MFGIFKKKDKNQPSNEVRALLEQIHVNAGRYYYTKDFSGVSAYQDIKKLAMEEQKELVLLLLDEYRTVSIKGMELRQTESYDRSKYFFYGSHLISLVLSGMLRRKLNYNEAEWMSLFDKINDLNNESKNNSNFYFQLSSFPFNYSIKQIEYHLKKNEPSQALRSYVEKILQWKELKEIGDDHHYGSDLRKSVKKLEAILGGADKKFLLREEDVGPAMNKVITQCIDKEPTYNDAFLLMSNVSGSKPKSKFTDSLDKQVESIGIEKYRRSTHALLSIAIAYRPVEMERFHVYEDGSRRDWTEITYLCNSSQNFIKGLVWTCRRFSDKDTILLLTQLAINAYNKIPGKGPAAASVGNACVYVLGNMRGKDGLGALSRLKLKVRQNNVKKTIDKYLLEGAKKYNVSVEELKEMAVPAYGLTKGGKNQEYDDYKLNISLNGTKVVQQWIKPDGSQMKSLPSKIKNTASLKKKLARDRKEVKEIQKVFSAQKQRIDNQYILDRTWSYESFQKYYLDHGLVYPITSKLIWSFFTGDRSANCILLEDKWKTIDGKVVDWIDADTKVKLWHPVNATEEEIIVWRNKMMELEWKQPIKQAFRELYLLTDAEVNTRSYSNRMAAHILKQHQFNTLANLRDWKYSLMGAYDDGRYNEVCSKILPEHNITAEYWIDELTHDEAFNDAGIWLYVATDQVKFKNSSDKTMDLIDVPKMVFTEIMRDVDLFVGVCSVGNDPQWMDNNGDRQEYRDYWQSYSFGDLNEISKTRKGILEKLLPRLKKIRDKSEIKGKFLIVQGKLRSYKIHIGSGNILMEPNDQYLCIVPSRSTSSTDKLFIPFEGDRGLSIVLSKAFMLAEDDKIDDSTITSQIARNIG